MLVFFCCRGCFLTQVEGGGYPSDLCTQEQRRLVLAPRGCVHGGQGAGADERRDERPPLLHAVAPLVPTVEGEASGKKRFALARGLMMFCWVLASPRLQQCVRVYVYFVQYIARFEF